MKFSVIIPLYNKAPYVQKAIESVLHQTFGDWELIVVDDCSTDGSGDIVAGISDSRIQLVRLEKNGGVGAARNKGVTLSSAPYLCFLDADDWWEPTFIEEMAGLIERHPEAGIYGTGYWIVKHGKKRLAPIGIEDGFNEGEINYCQVYAKTLCMPLTSITSCIPRKVFDTVGGFPTNIKLGEDFLLWIQIALKYPVVFLNKPLSNYNQDVDVANRGIGNLKDPKHHMLWNLNHLEPEEKVNQDYKQLIDNLRVYALKPYYLSKVYHNATIGELKKVDWTKQPKNERRFYNTPLWMLRLHHRIMVIAYNFKKSIK